MIRGRLGVPTYSQPAPLATETRGDRGAKVKALHGLNSRMHGITVMTYDQLLARCSVLLGQVHSEQVSEVQEYNEDLSA